MGKRKSKLASRDQVQPGAAKVAKLIETASAKLQVKEWGAAENLSRQAIAEAREHLDSNDLLQGRANLQLGNVMLSRGHYAQARKPIEAAQRVAEAGSDHMFRSQVYGAMADLYFLQKRRNNEFHKELISKS